MANLINHNDGTVSLTRVSPFSGKPTTLRFKATMEQFTAFEQGQPIQNAFPDLDLDTREFILTGITPKEWEDVFKDKEE